MKIIIMIVLFFVGTFVGKLVGELCLWSSFTNFNVKAFRGTKSPDGSIRGTYKRQLEYLNWLFCKELSDGSSDSED